MSFEADQLSELVRFYKKVIVSNRRNEDSVFNFFMFDSESRGQWIDGLHKLLLADIGDLMQQDELDFLDELVNHPGHNAQYALWLSCIPWYGEIQDFLLNHPQVQRSNVQMLEYFICYIMPYKFEHFLNGHYTNTDAYVRHMRALYVFTVPCMLNLRNFHSTSEQSIL
jgi:hypothetical protein